MTGEIGTSHTARQYRYYRCNRSKQHKCDKKTVRKDWIEELVVEEILSLISSDDAIEELVERVYEMQSEESNTVKVVQNQLDEVERKLRNLAEAIAQGIFSSTTKKMLDELEEQKSNLELELFQAQIKNPVISKKDLQFMLSSLRNLDISTKEGKQMLIDTFVNSIYLYDDYFVITFNYKGQSKTVSYEQLNSSPLTSKGSPITAIVEPDYGCFVVSFGCEKSERFALLLATTRAQISKLNIPVESRQSQSNSIISLSVRNIIIRTNQSLSSLVRSYQLTEIILIDCFRCATISGL